MSFPFDPEETNVLRFQRRVEKKYGVQFEDYWEFHKWSVEHYEEVWAEVFDFLEIVHSRRFTKVVEPHQDLRDFPEWFPGALLNFSENMLRHKEGTALILLGEENPTAEEVSFQQLREEVSVLREALCKAGIKKGDIIACYMSTRKEALVSMLAAGAIGAIFTAVNPLMGVQGVISRLKQVSPKVLFTVDRHVFDQKERNLMNNLPQIVESLPELKLVIIVPSNSQSLSKTISHIPHSCFYPDFIATGFDSDGMPPEPRYEQLPFSHPFTISFTSGTTGPPKGIVHSAGAALLVNMKEMSFELDVRSTDVTFMIHMFGWVSCNVFVGAIPFGATTVLYDGRPYSYEEPSYWDLVDKLGVTIAFLTPTILEEMENKNIVPGPHNTLKTLRSLISGSCPVKAYVFDFVQNKIKKDLYFTLMYGCTEFLSMLSGPSPNMPVHKEEMQAPALGLDILCYNQSGESVLDEEGELVIKNPWPSHPLYMLKSKKQEKVSGEVIQKFPGVWWIGDICKINSKTYGLIVPGRSDDTIKNGGARFGSSEIYGVVNKLSEVEDSICVSRVINTGYEVAVLFVKMISGQEFTPEFVNLVKNEIKEQLALGYVPEIILPVKGIPLNVNGKRMETLVKKILAGARDLPLDALANPECINEYMEYAKIM